MQVIGYFIDGYDEENNIAYEVDEKYHLGRKEEDKIRQERIVNKLKCKFIRIEDY